MRNRSLLAALILVCLAEFTLAQDQWPQWRGPHFNGSSDAKDLPDRLDASTQLWSLELPGQGAGTPIVWKDRMFLTGIDDQSMKLLAMSISRSNGQILWKKEVGEGFETNERNNMASPSALTDGKLAFFYYASGDLVAFDLDGNQKWARNLQKDFGPFHMNWIYGSSPLLYGGKLYVEVLHRDVPRTARRTDRRKIPTCWPSIRKPAKTCGGSFESPTRTPARRQRKPTPRQSPWSETEKPKSF